jgi:hypothetical protein
MVECLKGTQTGSAEQGIFQGGIARLFCWFIAVRGYNLIWSKCLFINPATRREAALRDFLTAEFSTYNKIWHSISIRGG